MAHLSDNDYEDSPKRIKYDRQLRLWDYHGQYALESAHVCLINATATGTEILKSLVLPGVGAFTILDDKIVQGEDAGNNFFLDKDSIGKSRAKVATDHLLELNPDVRGGFLDATVDSLLQEEPNFFAKFSVVVATNMEEEILLKLADTLWKMEIPLLVCRSYGMIGYMRLQFLDRTIIETRPENEFHDLRLDRPFPTLRNYVDSINMDELTDIEHSHIPFVVILLKYLDMWKKEHKELPRNSLEKNLFKEIIKKGMRKNDEENFEEAISAVNSSVKNTSIPNEIHSILSDPSCNITSDSKPFWILVKSLKDFMENEGDGSLPVRGIIPDMASDTANYIKLQNIYKSKATADANAIYNNVQNILSRIGKAPNYVTEQNVKVFCRNAHCLRVLKGRSMKEEYDPATSKVPPLIANLEHEDSDIIFYVLLRAVDKFRSEFRRFPGENKDEVEQDILKLKNCVTALMAELNCVPVMKDDYVHDMCRFGAAELHSVAAFIGGCAAHEIIKLITGQYVPFNNTVTYYALNQNTSIFYL